MNGPKPFEVFLKYAIAQRINPRAVQQLRLEDSIQIIDPRLAVRAGLLAEQIADGLPLNETNFMSLLMYIGQPEILDLGDRVFVYGARRFLEILRQRRDRTETQLREDIRNAQEEAIEFALRAFIMEDEAKQNEIIAEAVRRFPRGRPNRFLLMRVWIAFRQFEDAERGVDWWIRTAQSHLEKYPEKRPGQIVAELIFLRRLMAQDVYGRRLYMEHELTAWFAIYQRILGREQFQIGNGEVNVTAAEIAISDRMAGIKDPDPDEEFTNEAIKVWAQAFVPKPASGN